jgi:hypothetical protein
MRETELHARIQDRMSALRFHVAGRSGANLNDGALALETLFKEVLVMTRGWQLTSTNFDSRNFPAIDLHDTSSRLAVQVTVNVNKAKILATQEIFTRRGFWQQYDTLYFVGLNSVQKTDVLNPQALILRQDALLNLSNLNLSELETLDARLAASIPWQSFTQQSDAFCFDVVLSVFDRDAIRHTTRWEGSYPDMLKGLRQVKQIVTEGRVGTTNIVAKPQSFYTEDYREILEFIDVQVGIMMSMVAKNMQNQVWSGGAVEQLLDSVRTGLVARVNAFSAAHGHTRNVVLST